MKVKCVGVGGCLLEGRLPGFGPSLVVTGEKF
jgi:hypothetical protein